MLLQQNIIRQNRKYEEECFIPNSFFYIAKDDAIFKIGSLILYKAKTD